MSYAQSNRKAPTCTPTNLSPLACSSVSAQPRLSSQELSREATLGDFSFQKGFYAPRVYKIVAQNER